MTAQKWTARTTPAQTPGYTDHLRMRVFPQLRTLDGKSGAFLLRRDVHGETKLIGITRWRPIAAARVFAGADIEAAVVEDEAAALLSRYDERVRRYDIVAEDA